MRPYLERLAVRPDTSWSMLDRRLDDAIPFQWHHHPEFELTLTLNSRGQRFIGDHVDRYDDADLVLVGPNLPHTWSSSQKVDSAKPHRALVFWFRQNWIERLAESAVEFKPIHSLVTRAAMGLKFTTETCRLVEPEFRAIFDRNPPERLLGLLGILSRVAEVANAVPLAKAFPLSEPRQGRERIDRVLTHVHASYANDLKLDDLAEIAALSVSGLHRLFLKQTQATVSDYVMHLRIGDACARLAGTDQPIQHVAQAVGYRSLANFNRQFRRLRAMTPRAYRAHFGRSGL